MSYFDQLYSSVYLLIKLNKPKSARRFARNYVLVLKTGLILCILLFFMNFSKQMHLEFLSHKNAQIIFLLIFIVNIFNNWMYYNGKRHSIIISINKSFKNQIFNLFGFHSTFSVYACNYIE